MLKVIYEYYKAEASAGALYSFEDLLTVELVNDDLERYMNNLDMVTNGIDELPSEDTRKNLLLRQLRKSPELTAELAHFERKTKRKQTYEWSYRAIQKCVERKRRGKFRDATRAALNGLRGKTQALAAPLAANETTEKGGNSSDRRIGCSNR